MKDQEKTAVTDKPAEVVQQEVAPERKLVQPPVPAVETKVVPPAVPKEPVHLGHPASHKASPPLDCDIETACRHAISLNRSVVVIVKSPSDVRDVQRLMEGCKRQWIVRVSPRQTQKVLVRTQ